MFKVVVEFLPRTNEFRAREDGATEGFYGVAKTVPEALRAYADGIDAMKPYHDKLNERLKPRPPVHSRTG